MQLPTPVRCTVAPEIVHESSEPTVNVTGSPDVLVALTEKSESFVFLSVSESKLIV